jgi:hypothetical protein
MHECTNNPDKVWKMVVELKFSDSLSEADPMERSCLIIGQLEHLKETDFTEIEAKLRPRVDEEVAL